MHSIVRQKLKGAFCKWFCDSFPIGFCMSRVSNRTAGTPCRILRLLSCSATASVVRLAQPTSLKLWDGSLRLHPVHAVTLRLSVILAEATRPQRHNGICNRQPLTHHHCFPSRSLDSFASRVRFCIHSQTKETTRLKGLRMMPPPGHQIYLRSQMAFTFDLMTPNFVSLLADYLWKFSSKSVHSFSKHCDHKF